MTTASLTKHAHDPGDPQVASHCPFCGSGAIVGRSDGTIACDMCGMNFLIRVQPAYPGMPQAPGEGMAPTDVAGDMGMGLQAPPGDELAPGQEELGPDGEPLEPGDELEDGEEGAEDEGGPPWAEESDGEDEAEEEGPPPPKSKKKSSRRTADFRQVGPVASDDLQAHLMSHHGWSAEDLRDAMAGNSGPWEEANLANHHDWDHSEYTPAMIPGSSRVLPGGVIPHMHSGQYDRYGPERLLPYSLSVKAPPRTYLTLSGARLTEDAYVRHLACLHSGNSPQVLAKLRSQAALQMIIAAKTAASPVALAPLGHEDICERCGAPALVRTQLPSGHALDWCGHHYREHAGALREMGATLAEDRRTSQTALAARRYLGSLVKMADWGQRHYEDFAALISRHPLRERLADTFSHSLVGSNPNSAWAYNPQRFRDAASQENYQARRTRGRPNYTEQHYRHVAHTLNSMGLEPDQLRDVATHFGSHFQQLNPRFKPSTFYRAALTGGPARHPERTDQGAWEQRPSRGMPGYRRPPRGYEIEDYERGGPNPYRAAEPHIEDYHELAGHLRERHDSPLEGLRHSSWADLQDQHAEYHEPGGGADHLHEPYRRPEQQVPGHYRQPGRHHYETSPTDPSQWDEPYSMHYGPGDEDRPIDPVFGAARPKG